MKVLLVRLSAIGDVVQSLGAVRALAEARPELELAFVTQGAAAPLLQGLAFVRQVVVHERGAGVRGLAATASALRRLRPEVALDLQGNWKSALVARLSGARRRIGAAGPARREPASAWLLNERVDVGGVHHPAAVALQVVRRLAPEAVARPPRLAASDAEVAAEAAAVRRAGVDPDRPFRVLVQAHPRDPRAWPPEALASEARAAGAPAVCLLGPAEPDVAPPAGMPFLRHGPGELRRLVALGALVAAAGGSVIGPDQGATHVLAAAGARTVALFGPQDPRRTAPPAAVVRRRRDGPACVPCRRRRCLLPEGPICMRFTLAESVAGPAAAWDGGAPEPEETA